VTQEIDRVLSIIDTSGGAFTTGLGGILAANVPGTPAHDASKLLDTIKANTSFEALQAMRNSSPTGGALGSITPRELDLLQATKGNLEQSQTEDQLRFNLNRLRDVVNEIVNGPSATGGAALPGDPQGQRWGDAFGAPPPGQLPSVGVGEGPGLQLPPTAGGWTQLPGGGAIRRVQ
jgi:hypothetical protein